MRGARRSQMMLASVEVLLFGSVRMSQSSPLGTRTAPVDKPSQLAARAQNASNSKQARTRDARLSGLAYIAYYDGTRLAQSATPF